MAARVGAIPAYLRTARVNLEAGKAAGNTPDWRMLQRDGLNTSAANAKYFGETLPKMAEERLSGPQRDHARQRARRQA